MILIDIHSRRADDMLAELITLLNYFSNCVILLLFFCRNHIDGLMNTRIKGFTLLSYFFRPVRIVLNFFMFSA